MNFCKYTQAEQIVNPHSLQVQVKVSGLAFEHKSHSKKIIMNCIFIFLKKCLLAILEIFLEKIIELQ